MTLVSEPGSIDDRATRYADLPELCADRRTARLGLAARSPERMGVKPTPGRGLTMLDIAVGSYGEVPDRPPHRSMAPRGADVDPDTPDMGYLLNRKTDVWAENVTELYEEAVAGSEATRHPRGRSCRNCRTTSSTPCARCA
ncbi:MAG: hypothetical protein R2705_11735 [Ilumatobacteraceae bacterium]